MQARRLPATTGWLWITQGWHLMRRQPLGFAALFVSYAFSLILFVIVGAALGQLASVAAPDAWAPGFRNAGACLVLLLIPGLSMGFAEACRAVEAKKPVFPHFLFLALTRSRKATRALLGLGLVEMLGILLLVAIIPGAHPDLSSYMTADGIDSTRVPIEVQTDLVLGWLAAFFSATVVLWYGAILVSWHGLSSPKAVFFSLASCWRNWRPFLVYTIAWLMLWIAIPSLVQKALLLSGLPTGMYYLIAPLYAFLTIWMFCSFYATYTTVFVLSDAAVMDTPSVGVS